MPRNNLQVEVNEVKENGRRKIVITILAPEEVHIRTQREHRFAANVNTNSHSS